jgi:hypothetical protein
MALPIEYVVPKGLLLALCSAFCFSAPVSRADSAHDRHYRLADRVFLRVIEAAHACNGTSYIWARDRQCTWDLRFENDNEYNVHVTLRIRTHDSSGQIREDTPDFWLKPGYLYCADVIRALDLVEVIPVTVEQTAKDPGRETACRNLR